jgi:transposase
LIHGARAILNSKNFGDDPIYIWAKRLEAKKGSNKACVALAHKLARICFAILRDSSTYKGPTSSKKNRDLAA